MKCPFLPLQSQQIIILFFNPGFQTSNYGVSLCLSGRQMAVIRCVRAGRKEVVEDTLCDESLKPRTIMRMCNPQPCPAR